MSPCTARFARTTEPGEYLPSHRCRLISFRRFSPAHMPLTPVSRVGAYEIAEQIGAGGMGEVFRAVDTSLNRTVPIKVLPLSLAQDADRLARFEREAHTLAALNHPNIAQVVDGGVNAAPSNGKQ